MILREETSSKDESHNEIDEPSEPRLRIITSTPISCSRDTLPPAPALSPSTLPVISQAETQGQSHDSLSKFRHKIDTNVTNTTPTSALTTNTTISEKSWLGCCCAAAGTPKASAPSSI